LKSITFSKIFTLSFISLILGSCFIPIFTFLIDFIKEITFVMEFYFFYQLQININIYLFEQIFPYSITGWLIFEFILNPGLFKLKFSRPFRNFVLSKILKKKIKNLVINSKNLKLREDESGNECEIPCSQLLKKSEIIIKTCQNVNSNLKSNNNRARFGYSMTKFTNFVKNFPFFIHSSFFSLFSSFFSSFSFFSSIFSSFSFSTISIPTENGGEIC